MLFLSSPTFFRSICHSIYVNRISRVVEVRDPKSAPSQGSDILLSVHRRSCSDDEGLKIGTARETE
jgi:hypothetical protein